MVVSKHYEKPKLVDLSAMEWEAGAGQCSPVGSSYVTTGCATTGQNEGAGGSCPANGQGYVAPVCPSAGQGYVAPVCPSAGQGYVAPVVCTPYGSSPLV
jgi:hypothetical protein